MPDMNPDRPLNIEAVLYNNPIESMLKLRSSETKYKVRPKTICIMSLSAWLYDKYKFNLISLFINLS